MVTAEEIAEHGRESEASVVQSSTRGVLVWERLDDVADIALNMYTLAGSPGDGVPEYRGRTLDVAYHITMAYPAALRIAFLTQEVTLSTPCMTGRAGTSMKVSVHVGAVAVE